MYRWRDRGGQKETTREYYDRPWCPFCHSEKEAPENVADEPSREEETIEHVFIHCPKYNEQRELVNSRLLSKFQRLQAKYPNIKLKLEEMDLETLQGTPKWLSDIEREDNKVVNDYFIKLWRGMKGIWNWSRKQLFEQAPQKKNARRMREQAKVDTSSLKKKSTNEQPAGASKQLTRKPTKKQRTGESSSHKTATKTPSLTQNGR